MKSNWELLVWGVGLNKDGAGRRPPLSTPTVGGESPKYLLVLQVILIYLIN